MKVTHKLLQPPDMLPRCAPEPTKTKREITSPSRKLRFREDFREILSAEEQEQSESTGQHGGTKRFKALFFFFNKVNSKTKFTSLPLPELVSSSHTRAHKTEVSNREKLNCSKYNET